MGDIFEHTIHIVTSEYNKTNKFWLKILSKKSNPYTLDTLLDFFRKNYDTYEKMQQIGGVLYSSSTPYLPQGCYWQPNNYIKVVYYEGVSSRGISANTVTSFVDTVRKIY